MDAILVLNAGSSSLKFALYRLGRGGEAPTLHARGQVEGIGTDAHLKAARADGHGEGVRRALPEAGPSGGEQAHEAALQAVLDELDGLVGPEGGLRLRAAGHRVVHGGPHLAEPVRLTDDNLTALRALIPLAPLHQPHNLRAVEAVRQLYPELPQIACFDTAFHRTQPAVAQRFALPRRYEAQGVLRYGFHGLSYQAISEQLPHLDSRAAEGRTIVAHLGAGASLCALKSGRSVDSTMGFTALDGLPMGQRCGNLDPGVVLHLLQHEGLDAAAIERLLYKESGLLGVSGLSSDMRDLLVSDEPRAAEAVELFCYRCVREIGALTASLGGLDALVFTAGIGERADAVRARILDGLDWLGLAWDSDANAAHEPRLTPDDSAVTAWVLPTDEEGVIARATARLI